MNNLSSPFTDCIQDCKLIMRKLRKKIYKHTLLSRGRSRRSSDCSEEVLRIFHDRNIPQFITEALLKRRNFDIVSIKNISISTMIPLEEVKSKTDAQEQEASQLYQIHKQRIAELKLSKERVQEIPELTVPICSSTQQQLNLASEWEEWREGQSQQFQKLFIQVPQQDQVFQQKQYQFNNMMESILQSEMALFTF